LIENLSDSFDPSKYTDDYKAAFQVLLDQKMKGQKPVVATAQAEAPVMDLMAALKASIDASKRAREEAPAREKKPAAKEAVKVAAKSQRARPAARRKTA
jgi:DNA end-binding protein Ku